MHSVLLFIEYTLLVVFYQVIYAADGAQSNFFVQHSSKRVLSVYKTFNGISKIKCAHFCASHKPAGTCWSAAYDNQTNTCQLSNDTSQTMVEANDADSTALILQDTMNDCSDVLYSGAGKSNGIYTVTLPVSQEPVQVYCDMETNGGGWTVFQNRDDGGVSFYRNSSEYENGFGDVNGEFWLGLKYIHALTAGKTSTIHLGFTDVNDVYVYEELQSFFIDGAPEYTLHVGEVTQSTDGTPHPNFTFAAGGSLYLHDGNSFSTYDADRDESKDTNCAEKRRSGWWHKLCALINPNGEYVTPGTVSLYADGQGGVIHKAWKWVESLKATKLMFRSN